MTERRSKWQEQGRGRVWAMALLLTGTVATGMAGRLRGCVDRASLTPPGQRDAGKEVVLPLLDGSTWRLSEQRGRVVLVTLWATWCGPCREETPELDRLAREQGGPVVVGVSLDDGADRKQRVQTFAQEFRVSYPLALGGANLALTGGVEAIPTTMLFDREGRLAKMYVGAFAREAVEQDVRALRDER